MELSVAIVSYNARKELEICLSSLFENTVLRPLQAIVADNASSDGSVEMVEQSFPEVELIRSPENSGFARASNLCWRRAAGSFVVFLNSDALVRPGALDQMVSILRDRPEIGALGPLLRNPDGSIQMSFGTMMSFTAELRQKLLNVGYANGRGPLRRYLEHLYENERDADWVSGACLMARRALLSRVGGFDESFFLYGEDVDLCARIRATGARVVFTPEAEVTHLLGRSVAKNREKALLESHRSRLYFYRKHHGRSKLRLLKLYMAVKIALAYLFVPRGRSAYAKILRYVREV